MGTIGKIFLRTIYGSYVREADGEPANNLNPESKFGYSFFIGPCEQERLKVQYTARRTFSMADSLTVGLTPC